MESHEKIRESTLSTVSQLYPDPWLHASDLAGKRVTVRITAVELQEFHMPDGTTKLALAVSFEKAKKRLILNKTMARALMTIPGTEVFSEWIGASVALAPANAPHDKATIVVLAAETHEALVAKEGA
jgi:hypothetical protein